ncbi:MAG: tRNA 2-thiouridine(34) synthase MnmA [Pseudomonadota bacterium]
MPPATASAPVLPASGGQARAGLNSLDLPSAPGDTRVVVAMSGGVDSSVVAAMLVAEGYDVVGITLQLYDHGAAVTKRGACCAGRDIHDARRVAAHLGIPHYVLDYESRFREDVIDDFADAYVSGLTPIPCVRCNQTVKFRDLLATARELDADCLATGHYVRRVRGRAGPELHRAADPERDQSYFLFAITPEQLDFLRFPLGTLASKAETRALAARYGLPVAEKPDSQDICFVPNGGYAALIAKLRPDAMRPGEIVHLDGRVLGSHRGVAGFTIGQRRGLGLGGKATGGEPVYVVRIDPEAARVVVGPRSALATRRVPLQEVNWLGDGPFGAPVDGIASGSADATPTAEGIALRVKVRSTRPPADAVLVDEGAGRFAVTLAAAEAGVAPGQACVFYAAEGDRVLGGGWIARD